MCHPGEKAITYVKRSLAFADIARLKQLQSTARYVLTNGIEPVVAFVLCVCVCVSVRVRVRVYVRSHIAFVVGRATASPTPAARLEDFWNDPVRTQKSHRRVLQRQR